MDKRASAGSVFSQVQDRVSQLRTMSCTVRGSVKEQLKSSIRAPPSEDVLMTGWLQHQSRLRAMWHRRWFVLTATTLYVYNYDDFNGLNRQLALSDYIRASFHTSKLMPKEGNGFSLEPRGAQLCECFVSSSLDEKRVWMEQLGRCVRACSPAPALAAESLVEPGLLEQDGPEEDDDERLVAEAQQAISGPALGRLTALQKRLVVAEQPEERQQAATSLGLCLQPPANSALVLRYALAVDACADVRHAAAKAMLHVETHDEVSAAVLRRALLRDDAPRVRLAAAEAMRRCCDRKDVASLRQAMDEDEDEEVVRCVLVVLEQVAHTGIASTEADTHLAASALQFALSSGSADVRCWAAMAIGRLGEDLPTGHLVLVRQLQDDKDEQVRVACAAALTKMGAVCAMPALVRAIMSDPSPEVRARVAEALVAVDNIMLPQVTKALQEALKEEKDVKTWRRISAALDACFVRWTPNWSA